MVGIKTTTWDKWRNVHATKGVMFISDQGWDTDEPGPGPTTVKVKPKEDKPRDIVVLTDGSEKTGSNQVGFYCKKTKPLAKHS